MSVFWVWGRGDRAPSRSQVVARRGDCAGTGSGGRKAGVQPGKWGAARRGRPVPFSFDQHPSRPDAHTLSLLTIITLLSTHTHTVFRHRALQPVAGARPHLGASVFVAPSATVAGDVRLGDRASVWFGAVVRGEYFWMLGRRGGEVQARKQMNRPPPFLSLPHTPPGDDARITIGDATNVQDGAVLSTTPSPEAGGGPRPLALGRGVTVGHGATIGAGAVVGDNALIGMGASVGEDAIVESGAIVAAGAVVPRGGTVPAGQLWAGTPAAFLRGLKPEEAAFLPVSADKYAELAAGYAKEGVAVAR